MACWYKYENDHEFIIGTYVLQLFIASQILLQNIKKCKQITQQHAECVLIYNKILFKFFKEVGLLRNLKQYNRESWL